MDLAANNIIEFHIEGSMISFASRWQVTHHVKIDGTPTESTNIANLQLMAEEILANWNAEIMPLLVDDCSVALCRAKRIFPTQSVVGVHANAAVGGTSGALLEPDTAALYSIRSDAAGRRGMGRRYIPGIVAAQTLNGALTTSDASALLAACQVVFLSAFEIAGVTMNPVIWSPTGSTSYPIVYGQLDRVLRKQQRRDYKGEIYVQS